MLTIEHYLRMIDFNTVGIYLCLLDTEEQFKLIESLGLYNNIIKQNSESGKQEALSIEIPDVDVSHYWSLGIE